MMARSDTEKSWCFTVNIHALGEWFLSDFLLWFLNLKMLAGGRVCLWWKRSNLDCYFQTTNMMGIYYEDMIISFEDSVQSTWKRNHMTRFQLFLGPDQINKWGLIFIYLVLPTILGKFSVSEMFPERYK